MELVYSNKRTTTLNKMRRDCKLNRLGKTNWYFNPWESGRILDHNFEFRLIYLYIDPMIQDISLNLENQPEKGEIWIRKKTTDFLNGNNCPTRKIAKINNSGLNLATSCPSTILIDYDVFWFFFPLILLLKRYLTSLFNSVVFFYS